MKALLLRFDLVYHQWSDDNGAVAKTDVPSYVVRLIHALRNRDAKAQFFVSASSVRAFPDMADVLVGEGHAVDPLLDPMPDDLPLDPRGFGRLLTQAEKAFRERRISWEGLAFDGLPITPEVTETLRGHYKWVAVRRVVNSSVANTDGVELHSSEGPRDDKFFANPTDVEQPVEAFTDAVWPNSGDDSLTVLNLHPHLLSRVDPACAAVRVFLQRAAYETRPIVTFRDL